MVLVNGKCNWRKKPRLLRGTAAAPTRTFIRSPSLASPPQRYKTFCYFHVCRRRDSWSCFGGRLPVTFFAAYPRYSKNCLKNQRFMKSKENCISNMNKERLKFTVQCPGAFVGMPSVPLLVFLSSSAYSIFPVRPFDLAVK